MVNVTSPTCIYDNCKTRPTFNIIGESKGLFCAEHKKDGMIDVINKKCKTNLCDKQVTNKYEGYCLHCFMHLFPDKPVSRN